MTNNRSILPVLLILAALSLFSGACLISLFSPMGNPDNVSTAVVQTVEARQTQGALDTVVAQITQAAVATETPTVTDVPTETDTPTDTEQPTETDEPSEAPTKTPRPPTHTPVPPTHTPTRTESPIPCYKIGRVKDITIADGTDVNAEQSFTKTWRLYNGGRCSWKDDFEIYFASGNALSAKAFVTIDEAVAPGEFTDVSVKMIAPHSTGSYTGFWLMRSGSGVSFGWGVDADSAFWVKIDVVKPAPTHNPNTPVDFIADYCKAEWRTTAGRLSCPSSGENFSSGSIQRRNGATLTGGYDEDETLLVTIPSKGSSGIISGRYQAFEVHDGDEFTAVIGCLDDSPDCNVTFQLNYSISGGSVETLDTWNEKDNGDFERVTVDLSDLDGEDVQIILSVLNNGSSSDDRAFWLKPVILR